MFYLLNRRGKKQKLGVMLDCIFIKGMPRISDKTLSSDLILVPIVSQRQYSEPHQLQLT